MAQTTDSLMEQDIVARQAMERQYARTLRQSRQQAQAKPEAYNPFPIESPLAPEEEPDTSRTAAATEEGTDADRVRELRGNRFQDRVASSAARLSAQKSQQAAQAFARAEQLLKQAKNIRGVITAVGAATALTGIGLLWTFIQWNIQSVITVFGLPGKEFVGAPWYIVFLTVIIDIVVFVAIVILALIAWAIAHPFSAVCALFLSSFGDTWYGWLAEKACSAVGYKPGA